MSYKQPHNRAQPLLLPPSVDDFIQPDNPVMAIDAYVDSLDLARLGFLKPQPKHNSGQPAFHPREMLKLYLYGYTNQIRSSRRLEREAQRNLELIWLMGYLMPSYKTIADFRKNYAVELRQLNKEFVLLCKSLDLIGGELVAIDGSFFHGDASKASIHQKSKIIKQLDQLEIQIADYQQALQNNDHRDDLVGLKSLCADPDIVEKLQKLKVIQQQKAAQLEQMNQSSATQLSTTDPDARLLNKGNGTLAGYNVQNVVDAKHKIIIHTEVTNDVNDLNQLAPMALAAKAILAVEELEVLADAGYYKQSQLKSCADANITVYVAEPQKQGIDSRGGDVLSNSEFVFDAEQNVFICPNGKYLRIQGKPYPHSGVMRSKYSARLSDCQRCEFKSKCLTNGGRPRSLYKSEYEGVVLAHRERIRNSHAKMQTRAAIVEHPFGTIKRRAGWDHFLVRGFKKVRGEWGLMVLCYNLTRLINIIGLNRFVDVCKNQRLRLT